MCVEDVALYTAGGDARLDAKFKMLLADKQLLSWILKAVVLEVGKYSYEEIAGFIEGEPEVGERPVHPNEKIEGRKNESSIVGEGVVTYDVIFDLVLPAVPKPIKVIVNVEGQNEFRPKPGYHLATRGVYYCARMISEQKNREFFDSSVKRSVHTPCLHESGDLTLGRSRHEEEVGQGPTDSECRAGLWEREARNNP